MDIFLLLLGGSIIAGALVVARALVNPSGVTIDDLLTRPDLAWPHGVQEEDPVRWRIEQLTPPGRRASRAR